MKCEDSIGFHFREVNHLMERCLYLRHLKGGAGKITASHGWMISYLYHNMDKEIYQKTMETEFHMAKSTVTSILQAMERSGYITREGVAHDARLKKILLTEEGKKLYRDSEEYIRGVEKRIRGDIPQEDLDVFMRTVMQMEENLKNYEIEATAK